MFFSILCTDKPGPEAAALRAAHLQAHTDYLMERLDRIVWAGAQQHKTVPKGSFYLIVAETEQEAHAFADEDPFAVAGLFEAVVVTEVRRGIFQPVLALGADPNAKTGKNR